MDMHGQFFDFPRTFSRANTAGIRPLATHLRYVPDFCAWGDKLVIASDDTSIMRNPLAGQSQSNLWFGKLDDLKTWGPAAGWGGVWGGRRSEGRRAERSISIRGLAESRPCIWRTMAMHRWLSPSRPM